MDIERPEYVFLGNTLESIIENSTDQHPSGSFYGSMKCFMVYNRGLNFSEIQQAMDLCKKLSNEGDNDDDDDDDEDEDKSGGEYSCLIKFLLA